MSRKSFRKVIAAMPTAISTTKIIANKNANWEKWNFLSWKENKWKVDSTHRHQKFRRFFDRSITAEKGDHKYQQTGDNQNDRWSSYSSVKKVIKVSDIIQDHNSRN